MNQKKPDEQYMNRAIELAQTAVGWTNPNPMVGAVIVKDGQIIAEGCHERYGQLHAERNALAHLTEDAGGATMYVTLEPCCHYGKQPPCTQAVIEAGIKRVVVGSDDPNPLVAGKGLQQLKDAGIEVVTGVCKEACDAINYVFFHYIKTKTPYVVMKFAQTLDGKIATKTGASQWITGDAARERVHQDRHRYAAIMVGIKTVLADDPMLNCRIENGHDPIRIVCDSHLRIPPEAKLVQTAKEIPLIVATLESTKNDSFSKVQALEAAGVEVLGVGEIDGRIDLRELMRKLGEKKIDSVLLEGGGTLNWSAMQQGIVNRVQAYIAPKLFGGADARSPVEGEGVSLPDEAMQLEHTTIQKIGDDYLLEGEVKDVYRNR